MGLHRDLMNLKGYVNAVTLLGSLSGGRVWVEDENGDAPEKVEIKTKTRTLIGTWHDIHDRPITFDARRFHQVEPHEGHMWALAAYTPRFQEIGKPLIKALSRFEMHSKVFRCKLLKKPFSAFFHLKGSGKPKDPSLKASSFFIHRKAKALIRVEMHLEKSSRRNF